jgi:hypothetical protein
MHHETHNTTTDIRYCVVATFTRSVLCLALCEILTQTRSAPECQNKTKYNKIKQHYARRKKSQQRRQDESRRDETRHDKSSLPVRIHLTSFLPLWTGTGHSKARTPPGSYRETPTEIWYNPVLFLRFAGDCVVVASSDGRIFISKASLRTQCILM